MDFLFSAPVVKDIIAAAVSAPEAVSSASRQVPTEGFAMVLNIIEYGILVPMVYFSILFCIIGIIARVIAILRAPAQPWSLKIYPVSKRPGAKAVADTFLMPQVRKHQPLFWVFLMLFHISLVFLFLNHLDLFPQISMMPEASKHMLGWGVVGVGFTLPLFYFLFRRFRTPNREITAPADYLLLILIIFLALFGDLMSWGNSWTANGFIMTKQHFAQYFDNLIRFTFVDPRTILPGSHYHFIVIHVLLADIFFIALPFSKVMHSFLSLPINMLRRK
jgi:nitrate reductase gamma subunit